VNNVELLSGGEMLVRFLRDEGVDYIYGYPGGALLHVYDALFKEPAVTHILVRHEQAATHMAGSGFRPLSNIPHCCLP
jgi:acetolactate synthase I/II/III large subunit